MVYEYALEPELVATWTDRRDCRYFKESFGVGQGRLVSRYPKRWKKLVWNASVGAGEFERKRLEVLLDHLSEQMLRRKNHNWDSDSGGWIENAEQEHQRCPFHAIFARTNPKNQPQVLTESDLDLGEPKLWAVRDMLVVVRKAKEMADAVAPLLRSCTEAIFIDPYFCPQTTRYRRSFEAFLERMVRDRPGGIPKRIEVHTAAADDHGKEKWYREVCKGKLHRSIPHRIRVKVRRLKQKQDGEKLHNRYILTDLGGVTFGTGLDEGKKGETDDITLMDRRQYKLRWCQYGYQPLSHFDQVGTTIEVVGTRLLRKRS